MFGKRGRNQRQESSLGSPNVFKRSPKPMTPLIDHLSSCRNYLASPHVSTEPSLKMAVKAYLQDRTRWTACSGMRAAVPVATLSSARMAAKASPQAAAGVACCMAVFAQRLLLEATEDKQLSCTACLLSCLRACARSCLDLLSAGLSLRPGLRVWCRFWSSLLPILWTWSCLSVMLRSAESRVSIWLVSGAIDVETQLASLVVVRLRPLVSDWSL